MNLLCSLIVAFMALFPSSAGEGGLNLRAWMDAYETRLYGQMAENFEREERERNADNCQNPSESEVSIEQAASKEAWTIQQHEEVHEVPVEETAPTEAVVETVPEITQPMVEVQPCNTVPIYAVNGAILDIGVQEYLYQRLCERGISWFMPYAILMAYQESRFNIYALNQKNLMDSGLFQMRSIYWPEFCAEAGVPCGDIFDPYLQIDVLTFFMARRASWGKTVSEMISAHSQSDYGGYSQEYVDQVMAHQSGLVRVR